MVEQGQLSSIVCGVDVVSIIEFARHLKLGGERFLQRIYTTTETDLCQSDVIELARCFAMKEAVSKTLGTGMRGVTWRDIEFIPNVDNEPIIVLRRQAAIRSDALRLDRWIILTLNDRTYVFVFVVAMRIKDDLETVATYGKDEHTSNAEPDPVRRITPRFIKQVYDHAMLEEMGELLSIWQKYVVYPLQ